MITLKSVTTLFWLPLLALGWDLLCWFAIYAQSGVNMRDFRGIYDIRTKSSTSQISPKSQFCFAGTQSWGRRSDHKGIKVLSTTQSNGLSNIFILIWNQYNISYHHHMYDDYININMKEYFLFVIILVAITPCPSFVKHSCKYLTSNDHDLMNTLIAFRHSPPFMTHSDKYL